LTDKNFAASYIEQREKGANEALKEPLVLSEPLAAATSQTQNVTQLKDYMVKVILGKRYNLRTMSAAKSLSPKRLNLDDLV
jgi:hypothetical protein